MARLHHPWISSVELRVLCLVSCLAPACGSSGGVEDETGTGSGATTTVGASSGSRDADGTATSGSTVSGSATNGSSGDGSASGTTTGAPPPPCDPNTVCTGATQEGECRRELDLPGGMALYYWGNLPLTPAAGEGGCHADVERVVIVQHGNSRNPWSYFDSIEDAAGLAGVSDSTLILAPYFTAAEDGPPAGFHLWEPGGSGWKSGDDSTTGPPISSFEVYDRILLDYLADTSVYPALEEVVITGHSAGGQFTQRYAVSSGTDAEQAVSHLAFRYIVLNPSSWLYLDGYRWDGTGTAPNLGFSVPSGTGCDSSYDDYKYGLSDIPSGHYVADHLGIIPDAFLARDVTYLMGDADTEIDADLDTSCSANLQGQHRFERGRVFASYVDVRYPSQSHELVVVPGVGHTKSGMYESAVGISTLFP